MRIPSVPIVAFRPPFLLSHLGHHRQHGVSSESLGFSSSRREPRPRLSSRSRRGRCAPSGCRPPGGEYGSASPIYGTFLTTPYSLDDLPIPISISHDSCLLARCWVPFPASALFYFFNALIRKWFTVELSLSTAYGRNLPLPTCPLPSSPGSLVPRSNTPCPPPTRP